MSDFMDVYLDEDVGLLPLTSTSCSIISSMFCAITPILCFWRFFSENQLDLQFGILSAEMVIMTVVYFAGSFIQIRKRSHILYPMCYFAFFATSITDHITSMPPEDCLCKIPFLTTLPISLGLPLIDLVSLSYKLTKNREKSELFLSFNNRQLIIRQITLILTGLITMTTVAALVKESLDMYMCCFLISISSGAAITVVGVAWFLTIPNASLIDDDSYLEYEDRLTVFAGVLCNLIGMSSILQHFGRKWKLARYLLELSTQVGLFAISYFCIVEKWQADVQGITQYLT